MNTTRDSQQAIRELFTAMEDAWNRGDGDAYAACFTEDASYTAFFGAVYRGRADIAGGHQALFDSVLKGTTMFNEIVEVRFYGTDTAVVLGRGDVGKKRPGKLPKVQTYTLVRDADGQWRIAAFQNTKRNRLMESITFKVTPAAAPRRS